MKKSILWIMIILVSISMVTTFSLAGCKEETAAEETAEEEAPAEEAPAEEAEVVAAEPELYIMAINWWGVEVAESYRYGIEAAEEYFGSDKLVVEQMGPSDFDNDKLLEALEAAIAMDPVGIIWYPMGIGEGPLMNEYLDSGGMVPAMNGTLTDDYKETFIVGTDNFVFGQQQAIWMVDLLGEEFKLGVMTMTDINNHIVRMNGVYDIIDDYPGIELVEPIMEQTGTQEGAAANAAAFIAANPDVDGFICTSALGGAAVGRALKEGGFDPGEKIVITSDTDAELLDLIEEGYITGTLAQSFGIEGFYMIATMHFLHNNVVGVTKDDAKAGIVPAPMNAITAVNRVTAENIELFKDLPMVEE